jgi:phosphopantetheinyl transferase (holo-ACP synthase)
MGKEPTYRKYVETIKKKDFISFFSTYTNPDKMFSSKELVRYSFPENAQSLAGRYLIKKTICDYICEPDKMNEIEIMNNPFGKPEVSLGMGISPSIKKKGIKRILCSISHSKNYIIGMTIFCF